MLEDLVADCYVVKLLLCFAFCICCTDEMISFVACNGPAILGSQIREGILGNYLNMS